VPRGVAIRRFVQARHTDPIALADLAEALHLSESRTAHALRESCGTTFIRLVTEERVRTAAGLLASCDMPIAEVAYRSGFGDLAHFHRTFKRSMGTTPRRYRVHAEVRGRR
jgi:AraC-like DNA-binding protein